MSRPGREPILLLDVDGVLNPFPSTPAGYTEYRFFPDDDEPVRLNQSHATWLAELAETFEIVWATAWGETANELICPLFGLPRFDVVPLPPAPFEPCEKLAAIAAFTPDRPAAWVDDLIIDEATAWAAERRCPTLLVEVCSAVGLSRKAVDELGAWRAGLAGGGSTTAG